MSIKVQVDFENLLDEEIQKMLKNQENNIKQPTYHTLNESEIQEKMSDLERKIQDPDVVNNVVDIFLKDISIQYDILDLSNHDMFKKEQECQTYVKHNEFRVLNKDYKVEHQKIQVDIKKPPK